MGGVKFSVHPLFFLLGFYFALTGRIFVFMTYTVCAVIHELGHSLVSAKLGYRLNKITLMPFGAVVSGGNYDITPKDEIKIALAGPFVNLAVGLFFVATWWIFPVFYAYTDTAVEACLTMAIINFIPVYPLDGGRVTFALLRTYLKEKTAEKICKISGVILSLALFGLFIASLFFTPNVTILLFSLFAFFGTMEAKGQNSYVRTFSGVSENRLKNGAKVNVFALDKSASVKKMVSLMQADVINEVQVYDKGEKICTLTDKKALEIAKNGEFYAPIGKYL